MSTLQLKRGDKALIKRGLQYALDELHNQIATCPNVMEYADEIMKINKESERIIELLRRIR